jgi:hypothetical protein
MVSTNRTVIKQKVMMFLFQDISSPLENLPLYMGFVYAKVLRLDADSVCKRKSRLRRKIPYTNERNKSSEKLSQSIPQIPRPQSSNSYPSNNYDTPTGAIPQPPTSTTQSPLAPIAKIPRPPSTQQTFVAFEDPIPTQPVPSSAQEVDLCTFSSDSHEHEFSNFAGPSSGAATTQTFDIDIDMGGISFSEPLPSREQLKEQHEAEISDKVRAALEFKQEVCN